MSLLRTLLFITLFSSQSHLFAQCLEELESFSPSKALDYTSDFGSSIDLYEDFLAISEESNDSLAINGGVVFIYEKQTDLTWEKIATLAPSNPTSNFDFGNIVKIGKNTLGISAYQGSSIYKTYVYTKTEGTDWMNATEDFILDGKLLAIEDEFIVLNTSSATEVYSIESQILSATIPFLSDSSLTTQSPQNAAFGEDYLVFGYPTFQLTSNHSGISCIYSYSDITGWCTEPEAVLKTNLDQVGFGASVALDADTVFILEGYSGTYPDSETNIYGFIKPITGWEDSEESFILSTGGRYSDSYGSSKIAVHGDYLVHNSGYDPELNVFKRSVSWMNQDKETALDLGSTEFSEFIGLVVGSNHIILNNNTIPGITIFQSTLGDFENLSDESDTLLTETETATGFRYGKSIDIDGDKMVIGSPLDGISGAIHYYTRTGSTWSLQSKILGYNYNDRFGTALELKDSILFVSATLADSLNEDGSNFISSIGKVYEYRLNELDEWELISTLKAPDLGSGKPSYQLREFGVSISYNDGYVVVGRFSEGSSEVDGRAFIFKWDGSNWNATAEIKPEVDGRSDGFGTKVELQDSLLFVGAPGNYATGMGANIFVYNKGIEWEDATEDARLIPSDRTRGDSFGYDFSINNSTVLAGAPNGDQGGSWLDRAGKVYVFEKPESGWFGDIQERLTLKPASRVEGSEFGKEVFISNTHVFVGGLFNENGGVFSFERGLVDIDGDSIINESEFINSPNPTEEGLFGSVIVGENVDILVGASQNDTEVAFESGQVFAFSSNNTYSIDTIAICDSYFWNDSTYINSGIHSFQTINAMGCDSLAFLDLTIFKSDSLYFQVASCNSYEWEGADLTESGIYESTYTNSNGCDSVRVLALTINESNAGELSVESCDEFEWEGMTFTESGTYEKTLENINGCDSVATLILTIIGSTSGEMTTTSCDSYEWEGQAFTESGQYQTILTNSAGCDSTVTLNLTILNSTQGSLELSTCDDQYEWQGMTLTESGQYETILTNSVGCDSTAVLNLTLLSSTQGSSDLSICNDHYEWEGMTLTESGSYNSTLTNSQGCDSLATLNLTILEATTGSETVSACESYQWEDMTLTESGSYNSTLTNSQGCDSLATLNLTILEATTGSETVSACESYQWEAMTLTESGTYNTTLTNSQGCDSLATLNLTILEATTGSETVSACESYQWEAMTLTESGTYNTTLTNSQGCDSLATLNLTILEATTGNETVSACESYQWEGITLTESGTYNTTLTNSQGCDSLATLNLTILEATTGSETVSACESYQWEGMTLTETGTYNTTLNNSQGCDSLVTLNLIILEATTGNETVSACESYQWEGMTLTESGSYNSTLTNSQGCDSLATLNLTILEATTGSETVSACESYQWEDMTLTESGTYNTTLTNSQGCDSLATLNLTILEVTTGSETVSACESYQWEGMTLTESGMYSTTLVNNQGCDSLAVLNLVIEQKINIELEFKNNTISLLQTEQGNFEYQWYFCETNDPIEGESLINYEISGSGSYYLEVVHNQCISISECINVQLTDTDFTQQQIKIFPNPARNTLTFSFGKPIDNVTIKIFNIAGRVLESMKLENTGTEIQVNIGDLEYGTYIIQVLSPEQQLHLEKILKK